MSEEERPEIDVEVEEETEEIEETVEEEEVDPIRELNPRRLCPLQKDDIIRRIVRHV